MTAANPEHGWLHTGWSERLRSALAHALHREVAVGREVRLLASLDGRQLLQVEAALRRVGDARVLGPVASTADGGAPPEPDTVAACLFTMAAHRNGFVREHAVRALGRHPGRLTLATAVIRCSDWAHPVADTAQALVVAWARHAELRALLFQSLDLLAALKARDRVMAAFWPRHLEPILLAPENEGLRWQAAQVGATAGRRFAHALIVRADPQRGPALHRLALSDRDPSVARAGLANAIAAVGADTRRPLLQLALRHPSATVRAEALRALGGEGLDDARGLLEGVLFDRAQAPRAAAAFLLRQLHGFDARSVWRAALDDRDARAPIALLALAAVAEAQDAPRLRAWGDAPSARVRIAVLRGLLRSGATDAAADLRAALRDVSPRVVRDALQLAAGGAMALDRRTFEDAYADAAGLDCRVVLVRAVRHLNLWDALLLLLRWSCAAPDPLRDVLARSIRGWLGRSTNGYAKRPHELRALLLEALPAANQSLPSLPWREIHFALRAALD